MGQVNLYLGDSLDIIPMLVEKIDAVITDPPYGVMLGEAGTGQERERGQEKYLGFNDTPEYIQTVCAAVVQMCIGRFGLVVVTPGVRNMWEYPRPDDVGCWYVPAAISRGKWGFQCMNPILYYGKSPYAGVGDGPSSIYMQATRDKGVKHPCPKPLKVMEWLVNKASKPGQTVLDPFMGSGTIGVACMQQGRNFVGIEIDPTYFEEARTRIENAQRNLL